MKNRNIAILLGFVCFILAIAIGIQIKTVQSSYTGVGKTKTENDLRDSVLKMKEKYDNAVDLSKTKEKELERLRQKALEKDGNAEQIKNDLQKYNILLGNTEVIGKGIILTVSDADPANFRIYDARTLVVHDLDLVELVNALKNAGAEAISINDQRITINTAITCIGNVIKINGEKVGAPYEIKAIGLPSKLYGSINMPGGYIELLRRDGVKVDIEQVEKETILIPKYNGVYSYTFAKEVE